MITLYHCAGARSMRPLWTLEEMGLAYELKTLPFPPRVFEKSFLSVNPLGTVPYLIDGDARMTESSGACLYLAETYGPTPLLVAPGEPDRADFLNWLFMSDATLTFPQTLVLRYRQLEPPERRLAQAADDYEKWFLGRMRAVDARLADHAYLCAGRFTLADIAVGYALHLAHTLGLGEKLSATANGYYERLKARPAFGRAAV
ncbi:MAG: glutathione S-transferase family protein [Caulobacterales bacterium]|jgi:glutathione S-transferase